MKGNTRKTPQMSYLQTLQLRPFRSLIGYNWDNNGVYRVYMLYIYALVLVLIPGITRDKSVYEYIKTHI